jgi:hypothetical protein
MTRSPISDTLEPLLITYPTEAAAMLKTTEITVKASQGGFEGYASTFYSLDRAGDVVMPGCYQDCLKTFLSDNFIGGSMHNWSAPLGKYTDAWEDAKGLFVKAKFSDIAAAKEMRTLISDGVIKMLSVGMEPLKVSNVTPTELKAIWDKAGYTPDEADLRRLKNAKTIRLIEKANLLEVSPVTVPANSNARIMAFKSWDACPPAFKNFVNRALQSARQMVGTDLKAGRVLSGKNELKLKAMLEVLASVTEEIENLLNLVSQSPMDATEEAEEEVEDVPEKKSHEVGVIEAQRLALLMEMV